MKRGGDTTSNFAFSLQRTREGFLNIFPTVSKKKRDFQPQPRRRRVPRCASQAQRGKRRPLRPGWSIRHPSWWSRWSWRCPRGLPRLGALSQSSSSSSCHQKWSETGRNLNLQAELLFKKEDIHTLPIILLHVGHMPSKDESASCQARELRPQKNSLVDRPTSTTYTTLIFEYIKRSTKRL